MDHGVAIAAPSAAASGRGSRDASAAAWPAVAAWGAGLVHLALGAGAVTARGGAQFAGLPLIALGAAFLVWGAVVLARGRLVAPRTTVAGVLAGLAAGALALAADPVRTSVAAVAAASVLLIAVGFGCGRALRAGRGTDAASPRLAGLLVAAIVVAGIVTPALAATEAGRHAHDHGEIVEPAHSH